MKVVKPQIKIYVSVIMKTLKDGLIVGKSLFLAREVPALFKMLSKST